MENDLGKIGQNSLVDNFVKTGDVLNDVCGIIESSREAAYKATNISLVQRNCLIGYRISEEEFKGEARSEYGASIIKKPSRNLTAKYGKGFTKANLYSFHSFYKCLPEIFHSVSGKIGNAPVHQTKCRFRYVIFILSLGNIDFLNHRRCPSKRLARSKLAKTLFGEIIIFLCLFALIASSNEAKSR